MYTLGTRDSQEVSVWQDMPPQPEGLGAQVTAAIVGGASAAFIARVWVARVSDWNSKGMRLHVMCWGPRKGRGCGQGKGKTEVATQAGISVFRYQSQCYTPFVQASVARYPVTAQLLLGCAREGRPQGFLVRQYVRDV